MRFRILSVPKSLCLAVSWNLYQPTDSSSVELTSKNMDCNISIAMATFNGEKHIVEQLESLASQTLLPEKLIVTDDGSQDETLDLIEKFKNHLGFPVQIIRNDIRLGYGRNFLKAASLSQSKYVAFCDQDDIWHPDKLSLVYEVITKKDYDLIVHGGKVVDASLVESGEYFPKVEEGVINLSRYSKMFIPGYAMTINRDLLKKLNYESRIAAEDTSFEHDLWIWKSVLYEDGFTCYGINKHLVLYRQHDSNVIGFSALVSSKRHATNEKQAMD
jgi:glycosyltransferase involved in cell wall biosynthesis